MYRILFLIPFFLTASPRELHDRVGWELDHIGYPADWAVEEKNCLQVAIVGSGMAGIATGYGLFRAGIHHIALFDENPSDQEGPWLTYAQMPYLRTPKEATGPCLFTPSLTFQAWYESVYGCDSWEQMTKPYSRDWGIYLNWLKSTLRLPVTNKCKLKEIIPLENGTLELVFEEFRVCAQKVVLATGRKGFGGYEIPKMMEGVPKDLYKHTAELRDYTQFKGKKIAIIGSGTSAFDSAAAALEAGALSVDILFRRKELPKANKFDALAHVGMEQGFYKLPDEWRSRIIRYVESYGTPPPEEALQRLSQHRNFRLNPGFDFSNISCADNKVKIGKLSFDFVILATGFKVDVHAVPELKRFASHIRLWEDSTFPYLGPHYQFLGTDPFLKHIYCFNYGALMSHGLTSSSIDGISTGALRLTEGIAADFFAEQIETFYNDLESY